MRASGEPSTKASKAPTNSPVVLLLGTIGDTTWRMFVPTIGLMVAGYYSDQAFGTKPWLFITGAVIGFAIAGMLIKQLLHRKI